MGFTLTTIPTGALLPASGKKVGGEREVEGEGVEELRVERGGGGWRGREMGVGR